MISLNSREQAKKFYSMLHKNYATYNENNMKMSSDYV